MSGAEERCGARQMGLVGKWDRIGNKDSQRLEFRPDINIFLSLSERFISRATLVLVPPRCLFRCICNEVPDSGFRRRLIQI